MSQPVTTTGDNGNAGAEHLKKPRNRPNTQIVQQTENRHADHGTPDLPPAGRGRSTDHTSKLDSIGTPLDIPHPIAEGEMKSNRHL